MKFTASKNGAQLIAGFDSAETAFLLWNQSAERQDWPLVQVLNAKRKSAIVARLRECGGIAGWRSALVHAEQSDFLCGRNTVRNGDHANWRFNLDSFIRPSMFVKILEGNYDNVAPKSGLMAVLGALGEK